MKSRKQAALCRLLMSDVIWCTAEHFDFHFSVALKSAVFHTQTIPLGI